MGELIQFPLNGKVQIQSEEDRLRNVKQYQTDFCLETSIELAYAVFDQMEAHGLDLSKNKKLEQDLLMVAESIKAAMLRSCDIAHPLQKVTEQIVNITEAKKFKTIYDNLPTNE